MTFTNSELTVMEALHVVSKDVFHKDGGIDLYTTNLKGVSFSRALQFLFKKRGIADNPLDVLKEMVARKWVVNENGLYYQGYIPGRMNTLCSCGRCSRYINRTKGKTLGTSVDGRVSAVLAEVFSGKDLNWAQNGLIYKAEHNVEEDETRKVKSKKSKQKKVKTSKRLARVWNETSGDVLKKEQHKRQRLLGIIEMATFDLMEME
jgi:hypothetical protein